MARILVIHAHPDDAEIFCGGTLTLLAERQHSISIATMTPGDCGSAELGPEEIAAVRRGEAAAAAALIGAVYECLERRDLAVFHDDASRRLVTEALRRHRPEIVLAASPVDYLCDHEAASALARDACFAAPAPNYRTGAADPAPALPSIPYLYFVDPAGGVDREDRTVMPDFVVDIGSAFSRKTRMLAQHRSQREWLAKHHGVDEYLEMMERWSRARGRLAGLEYAEGFRQYRGHPYPQSPLLQELLGPELVRRTGAGPAAAPLEEGPEDF